VGAGKTGLAFGDITAKYLVEGGTLTTLTTETITTLGTYQAPTSAAHIRIKELSASDPAKGAYEIHFHDTQVAAAGKKLWLHLSASNTLFEVLKVDLLDGDVRSIAAGVITATSISSDAITAAKIADGAIDAATFAAGAINAAAIASDAITDAKVASDVTIASVTGAVGSVTGNVGGNVAGTVGSVTGTVGGIAGTITTLDALDTAQDSQHGTTQGLVTTVAGYLDTEIAAILADTNELQTDWANGGRLDVILDARASQTSVDDVPTNAELATALGTADDAVLSAIDALPTAAEIDTQLSGTHGGGAWGGGSGSGSGAYTLTITVNDGSTALQNATVRLVEGSNNFTALTNASGVAVFAMDAATYSVAITKDGYQFTPTTKVVSATGSQTYSMTAVTITASDAGLTTGYAVCYSGGVKTAGIVITLWPRKPGLDGIADDTDVRTATSVVTTGLVEFTNLFKGGKYTVRRGTGQGVDFDIPTNAGSTYELPGVIGRE
jgi:hypothetical protein